MGPVKLPSPSASTATVVLAALILTAAMLPSSALTAVPYTILITLLAAELDRSGRYFGLRLVGLLSRLLPARMRRDMTDEWGDHVLTAGEQGLRPVLTALSLLPGALQMALRYRVRAWVALYLGELFVNFFDDVFATYVILFGRRRQRRWHLHCAYLVGMVAMPLHFVPFLQARRLPLWAKFGVGAALLLVDEIYLFSAQSSTAHVGVAASLLLYLAVSRLVVWRPLTPQGVKMTLQRIRG
jgi:hypothetical protein